MSYDENVAFQHKTIETHSANETQKLAGVIAGNMHGGEVIELVSDLGGGKTTFTQGLVAALGSDEPVASPTFTISREYTKGKLHIYHFDFYRLHEPGIIADELAEVLSDDSAIIVVEWGDIVRDVLPEKRLQIAITASGETSRQIILTYPNQLAYLMEHV